MKIKYMKMIMNSIDDIVQAKNLLYKLDKKSDDCIERIINLICTLKECEYNDFEYKLATNTDVLANRTLEEHMQLMKTLKEYDYNKFEYELATNIDVLTNRTLEEQIQLMKKLKECNYNENASNLATNINVLTNRTLEEQIQLMTVLKENLYNNYVLLITIDKWILRQKTIEEQILLIETLKKCCYNHHACVAVMDSFDTPLEKNIETMLSFYEYYHRLENKEIEGKESVSHYCNKNNIEDLNELKNYVIELEKQYGSNTDILLDTIVPVYKYDIKKHK